MNSFGFVQGFIYRYISYQVPHLMSQIVQGCLELFAACFKFCAKLSWGP